MRLLDRLDEFGLAKGRRITVPLVRQMLAEEGARLGPVREPEGSVGA